MTSHKHGKEMCKGNGDLRGMGGKKEKVGNYNAKNILMCRTVTEQNLLRKSKQAKEMNGVYKTRIKNGQQTSVKMFNIHFHQKI